MKVRYAIGGILVAALLGLPGGAAAKQGGQVQGLAAQQCAQEKAQLGKKAFRKRYGAKHTMKACTKKARARVASVLDPAIAACQDELTESGPAEFIEDNAEDVTDTLENAMNECIAMEVDYLLHPDADDGDDDELDDELDDE